jgi:hypothetical protein
VNRTCNEKMRARKERKQTRSATRLAAKERGRGGDTPIESECSDEEEEEGGVTLLPLLHCAQPFPISAISLIDRWGLQSACASQNKLDRD